MRYMSVERVIFQMLYLTLDVRCYDLQCSNVCIEQLDIGLLQ
jgi:hypothetical protein